MNQIKNLHETIDGKAYKLKIPFQEIPNYMKENLQHSFFDWQKKALENFLTYQAIKQKENAKSPTHLMFNMATGTGKTLLMAATILYYYKPGLSTFSLFCQSK